MAFSPSKTWCCLLLVAVVERIDGGFKVTLSYDISLPAAYSGQLTLLLLSLSGLVQGGPKKIDNPSSITCSWTLGSGTIPMAVNSDPFATFSPIFVLVDNDRHTFDIRRDRKRSSVSKLHDGLHLFLAWDSGLPFRAGIRQSDDCSLLDT